MTKLCPVCGVNNVPPQESATPRVCSAECALEVKYEPKEHRVPIADRPRPGEIWVSRMQDVVEITTCDEFGREFNYVRADEETGEIKFGEITQTDLLWGHVYRVDFGEEG